MSPPASLCELATADAWTDLVKTSTSKLFGGTLIEDTVSTRQQITNKSSSYVWSKKELGNQKAELNV